MTPEQKQWIDEADYESLLRLWRNAPTGEPLFQGDTGQYYRRVMAKKRDTDAGAAVAASKRIGWEG